MVQPIKGQGSHLGFPIGTKNTNLAKDVDDLLPVKFRQDAGKVEHVSFDMVETFLHRIVEDIIK